MISTSFPLAGEAPRVTGGESALRASIRSVLAVSGVAAFFTSIASYAYTAWGLPPPVVASVAYSALALVLAATEPRVRLGFLRSPVVLWLAAYLAITLTWTIAGAGKAEVFREFGTRCSAISFIAGTMIILDSARARSAAALAIAACIVLASALNVAELLGAISFADLPDVERIVGRPGGFYVNPNISAFAIALGLGACLDSVPRLLRVPLVIAATVGVAVTFSRGGAVLLVGVLLWSAARGSLGSLRLVFTVLALYAALLWGYQAASSLGDLDDHVVARIQLAARDESTNERLTAAARAWTQFVDAPLLGGGLGVTANWDTDRPHNMYLELGAQHGIIGLLLFPALVLALAYRNRRWTGFALTLAVAGLFSHNLLEDRSVMILIAFVAASAASEGSTDVRGYA